MSVYDNSAVNMAIARNNEVGELCKEVEVYKTTLKNMMDSVINEFPEDSSFCTGVKFSFDEINKKIDEFNSSIETMKQISLGNANRIDEARNND